MNLLPGMIELQPQTTAWRRDIHAHPELGFREVRTRALVCRELEKIDLRFAFETHMGYIHDLPAPA